MADTFTSYYNWTLPEVGASSTTWGTKLNANFTDVDLKVKAATDAGTTNASNISSLTTTVAGKLDKSGGTMTGFIILHADPASAMNPATKQYVDATVAASVPSLTAYMQKANNLSDLANAATARTNLGLADAATTSVSAIRSIPQNAQTGAYVLVAGDNGKHISITTGGATVNSGIHSVGDTISIFNNSGSAQTITQGASVTLRQAGTANTGNRTLAQYGAATLLCVASNTFVISGAGLS